MRTIGVEPKVTIHENVDTVCGSMMLGHRPEMIAAYHASLGRRNLVALLPQVRPNILYRLSGRYEPAPGIETA